MGTGGVTLGASSAYKGTSYHEYLIEIDGDGTVDTFRWSVDGGANFNESGVPVNGTTYAP